MHVNYLTKQGFEKLLKQKEILLTIRPEAVKELARAREMGDLSENGFYKGARAKLSRIDREVRHLERLLKHVKIIEASKSGKVEIGSSVFLKGKEGLKQYIIVGEHEANPKDKKISNLSPLGKELIGKNPGDTIRVSTPSGIMEYVIERVG